MKIVADRNAHRGLLRAIFTESGARIHSDFCKFSVSLIAIEVIRSGVVGNVNVRTSGVIEVCPYDTQAIVPTGIIHSGRLRNIGESTVAIVVEQASPAPFKPRGPHCTSTPMYLQFLLLPKTGG